jgi:hypothetical protein
MPDTFEQTYPHIARWVREYGWIEIGYDDYRRSFARALDGGGLIWEGEGPYPTMDAALQALEAGITEWLRDQGEE